MQTEGFPRITINPDVCFGKPTVRGMRIRVTDILENLAGGATRADILESFPHLEDADITACLKFGARATDHWYPFPATIGPGGAVVPTAPASGG